MAAIGARTRRRLGILAAVAAAACGGALLWWNVATTREAPTARKDGAAIAVVTARAEKRDVPVRLFANGTVAAPQSVEIRAQITSTVRTVHIREGQTVSAGQLLFSLDARAEEANLRKAQAQVAKDLADLEIANRNLQRSRELFAQKFVAQSALDAVQNQVDTLTGQLAVDRAAAESVRVALAYTEIRATFGGRTGAISVRPGSLVAPGGAPLVTVTQVDPIQVAFTLPEKDFPGVQRALAGGEVPVEVRVDGAAPPFTGRLVFVDNAVDSASATIRVKAQFANPDARLWPGMFVNVMLAPRVLAGAIVVPAQAVQTGPDRQFVYVVDDAHKVTQQPVTLAYVDEGFAVVGGVAAGARVVVEGAQNLRPGSVVTEAERSTGVKGIGKRGDDAGDAAGGAGIPGGAGKPAARRDGRAT